MPQGGTIFRSCGIVGRLSHQPATSRAHRWPPSALTAEAKTYLVDAATGAGSLPPPRPRVCLAGAGVAGHRGRLCRPPMRQCGFDGVETHGPTVTCSTSSSKTAATSATMPGAAASRTACAWCAKWCRPSPPPSVRAGGLRISPVSPANSIHDSAPQPLFEHLLRCLRRWGWPTST